MSDVVNMGGEPLNTGQPVPTVVEALEDLLERARSGDVIGIAVAVTHHDNLASYQVNGANGSYSILGAIDVIRDLLLGAHHRGG